MKKEQPTVVGVTPHVALTQCGYVCCADPPYEAFPSGDLFFRFA
jgi:hypothetical protein